MSCFGKKYELTSRSKTTKRILQLSFQSLWSEIGFGPQKRTKITEKQRFEKQRKYRGKLLLNANTKTDLNSLQA
jgi:hypothetical protein